ncbi:MAG: ATP-binding protein [Candidatus Dormibacteraceae bacterium]
MVNLLPRSVQARLDDYADSFRVVIINGPRQSGKTTLLHLHRQQSGGDMRSLDDPTILRAAIQDPLAFVQDGPRPLYIDEIQLGGDPLVRAVKLIVDREWAPGQFILSGSTRFLTVPTLSESLAGRAGLIELWPLSLRERTGSKHSFIDQLFNNPARLRGPVSSWSRADYLNVICEGGYPEALRLQSPAIRQEWFNSYLDTVIQRDIREFAHLQQARALPALLALIAARAGSTLAMADLGRSLGGISGDTVRNYLSYLEMVFLLGYVPAWSTNLTTKVARTPKAYLIDSGLAAHLLQATPAGLSSPGHPALGGLTETFVFSELTKAVSLAETSVTLRHLRDRDGREIDFLLESRDGRIAAIEVKASMSPPGDATRHLSWLRDRLGDRFVGGVMLYFGTHSLSHGDRILALPLSALWGNIGL